MLARLCRRFVFSAIITAIREAGAEKKRALAWRALPAAAAPPPSSILASISASCALRCAAPPGRKKDYGCPCGRALDRSCA